MEEKTTQRVTVDELARMIENDITHKEDIDRLGDLMNENTTKILAVMQQLPTKVDIQEMFDKYLMHQKQINELRDFLKTKFPDAHFAYDA
ncbi:MAG: hypothetical protein AAB482_03925 [Patescibacteria group bacterium]